MRLVVVDAIRRACRRRQRGSGTEDSRSCDNFLTDGSFRTVHEQQLEHTRQLRERAARDGRLRLVEVLEHDERSLTRILRGLDEINAEGHARDAAPLDVVQLAAARQHCRGGDNA